MQRPRREIHHGFPLRPQVFHRPHATAARPPNGEETHLPADGRAGRTWLSTSSRPRSSATVRPDHIWSAVQEELRFQLAKPSYETWLKNTTLLSAEESVFRIGVPSKLAKDWLEDRFAGLIQETLQAITGSEVEVDFVVSPQNQSAPGWKRTSSSPSTTVARWRPRSPTRN